MNLLEFISYCKLCGIIVREAKLDDVHKLVIKRGDVHVELMYNIKTEEISKCYMSVRDLKIPNPDIYKIIYAVLPNDIC